ncbi:hypothetical protein FRAHR75_20071 [Frankia sp. Hr75.2]|nr:hypothetical protein FRAHR75_20071 [Frankia sp. Hr75.2]
MRDLVTSGSGFLGSRVAAREPAMGHGLTGLARSGSTTAAIDDVSPTSTGGLVMNSVSLGLGYADGIAAAAHRFRSRRGVAERDPVHTPRPVADEIVQAATASC